MPPSKTTLADEYYRARALFDQNKIDEAFAILTAARARTDIVRTPWAIAEAEWCLGRIEERRGRPDLSVEHYHIGLAAADSAPRPTLEHRVGLRQNLISMLRQQGKQALVFEGVRDLEGVLAQQIGPQWNKAEPIPKTIPAVIRYYAYTTIYDHALFLRDAGNVAGAAALYTDLIGKLESDLSPEERAGPLESWSGVTGTRNLVRRLHGSYCDLAGLKDLLGQTDEAIALNKKALALPHLAQEAYEQMACEVRLISRLAARDGPSDELDADFVRVLRRWDKVPDLNSQLNAMVERSYFGEMRGDRKNARAIVDEVIAKARGGPRQGVLAYALQRSAELHLRERSATAALDEIAEALSIHRAFGEKLDEPELLKLYAESLGQLRRYAQAAATWREGIEMCRTLKLDRELLNMLLGLARCQREMGAMEASRQTWKQIENFIAQHPGLPPSSVRDYWVAKLEALKARGVSDELTAALAGAKKWLAAAGLTVWQAKALTDFDASQPVRIVAKQLTMQPLDLQPQTMRTDLLGAGAARARFTLVNPNEQPVRSALVIYSEGFTPTWSETEAGLVARLDPAPGGGESVQPVMLVAREELVIRLEMTDAGGKGGSATIQCGGSKSTWEFSPGAKTGSVSIVHESLASQSPFYAVSLYHEIRGAVKAGAMANIRVHTSVPCRVEIVDEKSGTLLAIDAQGRGDFQNRGDAIYQDADGDGFPDVPLADNGTAIGLCVYPPKNAYASDKQVVIMMSLKTENGWQPQAVDMLELRQTR